MDRVKLKIYQNYNKTICENTSRFFALLFSFQILALIIISICFKFPLPLVALFTNLLPILFVIFKASESYTKYIVVLAQVLNFVFFHQLGLGVFEVYIYVFISLLLLSAYRDYFILVSGVLAVLLVQSLRSIDSCFALLIEILILCFFIYQNKSEMRKIADKDAELVLISQKFDEEVRKRTGELEEFSYVLAHDARVLVDEISEVAQRLNDNELSIRLTKLQKIIEDAHNKIREF